MPVDTTSHISNTYQASNGRINCENSAVCSMGNEDEMEQMQSDGQLMESDDGGMSEKETEDAIEIDEASGQQPSMVSNGAEAEAEEEDDENAYHVVGTFSTCSSDEHLASSACLSACTPRASPESGFDGNYCSGSSLIHPTSSTIETTTSSRQTNEYDDTVGPFDFSIDVNQAANIELQTATQAAEASEETIKCQQDNKDEIALRHHSDQERPYARHRRRRSASIKGKRGNVQRKHSSSASSSSSDSDESSSSEDGYYPTRKHDAADMEGGENNKKSPQCLKRKLDDSCAVDSSPLPAPSGEWYSSPKVACIVHGSAVTLETTSVQHQNLNGLISVLQSAALTSDEPTKVANTKHDQDAVTIYDPESGESLPLTRSMSCPGLMELACES